MILLPEVLFFFFIIFLILLISYYFCWVLNIAFVDEKKPIFVIYLVEALGKICPVHSSTYWKQSLGAFRCWECHFPVKVWETSFLVFGCSTLIKASSLAALKVIGCTSNWCKWHPSECSKEFDIQHFEEEEFMQDEYMNCTKIISGSNHLEFYRFSHLAANNMGWVLFWGVNKVEWHFYLVQPDKDGKNKCLLTCICSGSKNLIHHLASSVCAIKDAIEISASNILPFTSSLSHDPQRSLCMNCDFKHSHLTDSSLVSSFTSKPKRSKRRGVKLFKLLPRLRIAKNLKKYISGARLAVEIVEQEGTTKCIKGDLKQRTEFHKRTQCHNSISSESSYEMKPPKRKLMDSSPFNKPPESLEHEPKSLPLPLVKRTHTVSSAPEVGKNSRMPPFRQRWFSESNLKEYTNRSSDECNALKCEVIEEDENLCSNDDSDSSVDQETLIALSEDEDSPAQMNSDFELLLPQPELSVFRLADMLTKGNYSASQIQSELLKASFVNLHSSIDHQYSSNDGWSFHSFHKGMTVLSKVSNCGSLKTVSYLCETEISRKVSSVWESVRNPRLSFVFDETVKKVRILEEISNDQKIIHIYHEINNLLKKETIDFCLLYTERQELSKYYLALHSVEYMNCPLMDSTIRGTLLPSGWIVEPSSTNEQKTKVSYLYQIIVNNPRSQFINDLSTSIPTALQNVKEHLMFAPFSPVQ